MSSLPDNITIEVLESDWDLAVKKVPKEVTQPTFSNEYCSNCVLAQAALRQLPEVKYALFNKGYLMLRSGIFDASYKCTDLADRPEAHPKWDTKAGDMVSSFDDYIKYSKVEKPNVFPMTLNFKKRISLLEGLIK